VCPIRNLLIAVSIFLEMFGGEGHARMVFLIRIFNIMCVKYC